MDSYVDLLRSVLAPRLQELGRDPLRPNGWMWESGRREGAVAQPRVRFALALTHDLDNLWRWTPRGFAATGYRSGRAVLRGDGEALRRELGDFGDWLVRHLPQRTDPFWTFPQILGGEDARGVRSTFYVIARHTHPRRRQPAGDVPPAGAGRLGAAARPSLRGGTARQRR